MELGYAEHVNSFQHPAAAPSDVPQFIRADYSAVHGRAGENPTWVKRNMKNYPRVPEKFVR